MEKIDYYKQILEFSRLLEAESMPAIFEVAEPAVNDDDQESLPASRNQEV